MQPGRERLFLEVDETTAEQVARSLFPDAYHDGNNCYAEIGREGEPCRLCIARHAEWLDVLKRVHRAMKDAI